jgi:protein-S-isoprenylcysteine O-methyltransferase Ste14
MSIDPYRSGDPAAAEREDRARLRFFLIGLVRLGGAFVVLLGVMMMLQRVSWVQGATARYAGFVLSVAGLFVFAILTRLMARRWASPREP